MSRPAACFVNEAAQWADELARKEARGPNDYLNAMRRVADRIAVNYSVLWNLRYRRPKTIGVESYVALLEAYVSKKERQYNAVRIAEHHGEEAVIGARKIGEALLRAADRVAGVEAQEDRPLR